ncbi:hypothetical protein WJX73_003136 [Symbiochloris irregularis]|uniref:Uncharacterized protein n=1 Tax=Symbiochloris irregularis TaxID=706552 RepID=A0AAW1NG69_9CHLO
MSSAASQAASRQSDQHVSNEAARHHNDSHPAAKAKVVLQKPGKNTLGLPVLIAGALITGFICWRRRKHGSKSPAGQAKAASQDALPRFGKRGNNKKNKERKKAERQRREQARQGEVDKPSNQRREDDPPAVLFSTYAENPNQSTRQGPVQKRKPMGGL